MIRDGVSYSAFIQYCRVILSRYSRTLLLPVFSRASTEYFCLWASIGGPVFPFQCNAVNTVRSTSSFQDSKTFPLARVYQHASVTSYLELEVPLTCHGRRIIPFPRNKNSGLANPS